MFTAHETGDEVERFRDREVPSLRVLASEREFAVMPTAWVYELAFVVDEITPRSYSASWVPAEAPKTLRRLIDDQPTIGNIGDGGVAWTRQTDPPLVFVKPRLSNVGDGFRDFLIAEAIQHIALESPEHPLGLFAERYSDLNDAAGNNAATTFRLAVSLTEAWRGRHARPSFAAWEDPYPGLHASWREAGQRIDARVRALPRLVTDGTLDVLDATELACSAIKHDIDLPSPFDALDVTSDRSELVDHYIAWVDRTLQEG